MSEAFTQPPARPANDEVLTLLRLVVLWLLAILGITIVGGLIVFAFSADLNINGALIPKYVLAIASGIFGLLGGLLAGFGLSRAS
jgi:hypothetical protein